MERRRPAKLHLDTSTANAALEAMNAEELRALICEILLWFDDALLARFVATATERAARSVAEWVPTGPTSAEVAEIEAFAEAAVRAGQAEPHEIDHRLQAGTDALLARDYSAATRIFRALLLPLGDGRIYLGQDEMVDEVLGVSPTACAAQYVVATYMTTTPMDRAKAVLSAIEETRGTGFFIDPLRELERTPVEPLPALDQFLPEWRRLIEARVAATERSRFDWDTNEDRWLREVTFRLEGQDGLAALARASKRASDLRAWCRVLVKGGDWTAALSAYDEAAGTVSGTPDGGGEFLDGAALAAQQLGRRDLPVRLERAWREAPSLVRLRRWLGSSKTKKVLVARVGEALTVCPHEACRQRALLHMLEGDLAAAAKLLAAAPGLGWSNGEHPGHLVFPLLASLLGGLELPQIALRDPDEIQMPLSSQEDRPRLSTPTVARLIELAEVTAPTDRKKRTPIFKAMRDAAEKRIAGVTEKQRRRPTHTLHRWRSRARTLMNRLRDFSGYGRFALSIVDILRCGVNWGSSGGLLGGHRVCIRSSFPSSPSRRRDASETGDPDFGSERCRQSAVLDR